MALEMWVIGTAANAIVSIAYLAIAYAILSGLFASNQLAANPLALATGFIFLSCGIGHGVHAIHALFPIVGIDIEVGLSARTVNGDWHAWMADGVTAVVGVWYWTLRGRIPALVRGTALFEDFRTRQREALEIHDNIVQGLAKAKLNFEVNRPEQGMREIEESLAASRRIITGLLASSGTDVGLRPGQLRGSPAAGEDESRSRGRR